MEKPAIKYDSDRPEVQRESGYHTAFFVSLIYIFAIVAVHSLYWLFAGIDQPIADLHQFRQTQTAITAYWMWRGGPLLAYETPVLGYPWSIPFEFPIYQYLLAALRLIGIPFAEGGRLLSFAFYLGLLWPIKVLVKNLGLSIIEYLIISILLLSSPLYIYWSRTVMIESCALFFALSWLASLMQFLRRRTWRDGLIATVIGMLAINAKITTFLAFGLIGGMVFLYVAVGVLKSGVNWTRVRFLLLGTSTGLVPLVAGLVWVAYADHLKLANLLASISQTSTAIAAWNFGSLAQRLSSQFWLGVILDRILPDTLGFSVIPALIIAGASLGSPKYFQLLAFSILGFFAPMLVFTNLHIEHNYYQYANALFLLAAVGFGVSCVADAGRPMLSVILLALIVVGQLIYFNIGFARVIVADYSGSRQVLAGALAKEITKPDESLLILGDDWSSAIAFYSERKSLTLPYWAPPEVVSNILARPEDYLGGATLGAIVYCPDQVLGYTGNQSELGLFVSGRKVLGEAGGCQLLAPQR